MLDEGENQSLEKSMESVPTRPQLARVCRHGEPLQGFMQGPKGDLCFQRVDLVAVQSLWGRESITRLLQRSFWLRDRGRVRTEGKTSVIMEVEWVQVSS